VQYEYIENLITKLEAVSRSVESDFGSLTPEQLNWKPSTGTWSIGQCLDHIIVSNETYYPQLEKIISGKWKNSLWQNMAFLPKMWGKILIKSVSPGTAKKVKTASVFYPVSSGIPRTIIKEFVSHNKSLMEFMMRSSQANHDRIVITSPVSGFITYSLRDTFTILTLHEERHLQQSKRVMEAEGFPA
jgi:DinB superfamily